MPSEQCPRAHSDMTPCIVKDGDSARLEDGSCVGCGEQVVVTNPPLDLDAIKARANAATPGPWSSDGDSLATYEPGDVSIWGYLVPELRRGIVFNVGSIITEVGYACEREREDADFIAAAREDVPALCDEVERLRKVIEDIGEYARAAYAEAAMRDHAGRSALNAIVNMARQTISKRKEVESE